MLKGPLQSQLKTDTEYARQAKLPKDKQSFEYLNKDAIAYNLRHPHTYAQKTSGFNEFTRDRPQNK